MNPDSPIDPRAAFESSLTALLLGELPHEQAAALHQKLAQDAELAKLYERLKQTIDLVRETVASPAAQTADQPAPLKLSEERRQKLLQQFKTVAPKEFARPRRRVSEWLVPVGIAAVLMVMVAATVLPLSYKAKSPSLALRLPAGGLYSEVRERVQISGQAPVSAIEKHFSYGLGLNRNGRMEPPAFKGEGRVSGVPLGLHSDEVAIPSARPVGTAIVLPKSGEPTDSRTTITVAEGEKPGSVSATLRGFYDDDIDRAGGRGGGGYGGGAGSTPGKAGRADGRQSEVAADNWSFGERPRR